MQLQSVTIGIRDGRVLLVNNTIKMAVWFSSRAALAAGQSIAYKARGVEGPERTDIGAVFVRREGEQILVVEIAGGHTLLLAPLEAALEIGHVLIR
jgi:hypothetical protein